MRVIDSHILLPNMQRAGRSATEQQTRASSPSEKSVSPFSRSIEANGAGCKGVWTPRATQQIGRASCRESVVSVRVDLGGRRIFIKTNKNKPINKQSQESDSQKYTKNTPKYTYVKQTKNHKTNNI